MHQGGVRVITRAMLTSIVAFCLFTGGFYVQAISPGDLLISKIQITGGEGKTSEDFVTIYNASANIIDLNGLRLVKRTKTGTSDTNLKSWVSPTLINPGAVYTWANSSNDFSQIIQADCSSTQTISDDNGVALREGADNIGTIIDSVAWGEATNIFVENSPFPTNPANGKYLIRKNNLDTNNNALDFELYPYDEIIKEETSSIKPGDIVINEFVSDPLEGDEWIEIYNNTNSEILLNSLTIEDGSGTTTMLTGALGNLNNRFLVINKPKGALNNSGDTIILKQNDTIIDSVSYGDWDDGNIDDNAPATEVPYSLARIIDGESTLNNKADFKITNTITKGLPNIITEPQAETSENNTTTDGYDYSKEIIISEIFPNPLGIDAQGQEFIEIYNKGTKPVFLKGWRFEINNTSFLLADDASISGKSYLAFITKNKLSLPNEGATLKLFQPGRLSSYQSINYKQAKEDQSFINVSNSWQWSSRPTPGTDNIQAQSPKAYFEILDDPQINTPLRFDASDSFSSDKALSYSWDFGDGQTNNLMSPEHSFTASGKFKISLTIKNEYGSDKISKTITIPKIAETNEVEELKEEVQTNLTKVAAKDDKTFTTSGIAVSLPGTHGSQYFYFLPEFGEPLYQIYNSKKLFPKIKVGDQLIISGTYEEKDDGPRLKTKEEKDIQIIGQSEIEEPLSSLSTSFTKPPLPRLASIEGEIVSKKWPRVYIADSLGEAEIYISKGTELSTKDFNIGDKIKISGILILYENKPRLQPRDKNDIVKIKNKDFNISLEEKTNETETITKTIEPEIIDKKKSWLIYIIAGTVLILGGAGYFLQKK